VSNLHATVHEKKGETTMEKSPKKKLDKLGVETAAIVANRALSFLYVGLSQSEWGFKL
jgi:hypothetical protein